MRSRPAAALVVLLALLFTSSAAAHLGSTKRVWIDASAGGADVRVDLDPIDVAYALELEDPDHPDADALVRSPAPIRAWAERVFSMRGDDRACDVSAGDVQLVPVESLRFERGVRVHLEFVCARAGANLRFRDDAIFETDRQHESIVRVGESATVLRVGRQELALGDPPSLLDTLLTFVTEGVIHLVTGYDHVLFLLSLLLVAGEVGAKEGRKKALSDVALIVTAFTLGHSITLIAAALDLVSLPSRLVESAIAASIIAVAVWNLVRPEARVGLRWVAGAFGLVHGFGFSSVLRELILPTGERVAALLAFNVGIELAQLTLVAALLPLLAWAGDKKWYRKAVVQGGSGVIALVALYWLVERVFDL